MANSVAAAASYLPDSIQSKVKDYIRAFYSISILSYIDPMHSASSPRDVHPDQRSPKKTPVGVGDLPGPDDESGVVVLPAERTSLPSSFEERLGTQPGERSDGIGSLPGMSNESGVALLPDERTTLPSSAAEKRGAVPGEKIGGVGALPGNSSEEGVIRRFEETAGPVESGSGSNGDTVTKPKMISKLKGEVKIIQGKISKNQGKVEEGRKLKMGM
jgi:hypothetical protein